MRGGVRSGRDPREAWELRRQPMDRCGLGWVAHETGRRRGSNGGGGGGARAW